MTRLLLPTIAMLAAAIPAAPAGAGIKYTTNGPNVLVPIVANTKQPIAPWVQGDPELAGNVVFDEVHDYLWTDFPAAAGKLQLRAVRSFASGRIALYFAIRPVATTPNNPTSVAIMGFKSLDFDIGRMFAGEKTAPVSHVRSEQDPKTKLYELVFTFDTPLPKDRVTWFVIKTSATKTEPGTTVAFADNPTGLGHGLFPFVRGASPAAPTPSPTLTPPPAGKP